jgi:hypothetical protein
MRRLTIAALVLLAACTPTEIATWERTHGVDLDVASEEILLGLPPAPAPAVRGPATDVTPPTPTDWDAVYTAQGFTCASWASEAVEAGWPHDQIPKLLRTIKRESWCMHDVRSGSRDNSLLQINDIVLRDMALRPRLWSYALNRIGHVPTVNELLYGDPVIGLIVGYNLYLIDGWSPWNGGA